MLRQCLQFKNIKFLFRNISNRNKADFVEEKLLVSNIPKNHNILSTNKSVSDVLDGKIKLIPSQERNNPLLVDPNFDGVVPIVTPSFNLASLVNKSELLQKMVKLGVSIHDWERKGNVHPWVMTLDFKKDVQPIIQFLVDQGVSPETLGMFFTKSPMILKTSIEELEIRTNYLQTKKFTSEMISRILSKNPYWLLFSTQRIDSRLGFVQKTFNLTGNELRAVTSKESRLITSNIQNIKMMNFGFREEMGFEFDQIKEMLLSKPKLWLMNKPMLLDRFDYLHNTVKMDHESILRFPAVLTCRSFRIKQRHEFLCHLDRAQYDPKLPNYVNPLQLIRDSDSHFAVHVAKTSIQEFNDFCKTM